MFLPSNITLKFGDSGDFVAELQRRLAMVKCFSEDQVNGFYDGSTVNGVMAFQGQNGLHADGVAGPETLRRLNGVIAGDTSDGSGDKKEEEAQQAHEGDLRNLVMAEQHAAQPLAAWGEPVAREEVPAEPAPQQPVGLDPAMFAPATAASAAYVMNEADRADLARQQQPPTVAPGIELAEMLLNASAQEQQLKALNEQAPPAQQPPAPMSPPEMLAPPPVQAQPVVPPVPVQEPQPLQQPVPTAAAEPQGLVQRAGRFANAMMQKLADYFEAKLPPSVLNEVKSIGNTMAAAGMKEAPIPTGPEMGGPAQQLPARGPEQQPAQTR